MEARKVEFPDESEARREDCSAPIPKPFQHGPRTVTITIHIPSVLRDSCGGAYMLSLSVPSVRAALEQIERSHPALYRSVCDETGAVRRHVNLFVNTLTCATATGSTRRSSPGDVRHHTARGFRRLNMPERVILTHRDQEGTLRRRGREDAARASRCAGHSAPGVAVYATLIDTRGTPAPLRLELQRLLRHEGPGLDRPRQKVQGDEVGARPSRRRTAGALANIWSLEAGRRQEGPVVRRRAGVALPQPRRRRFLGDGSGHQQPRARPEVAARRRRAVHAHDPARRQAHAPGHLDRRPLPERGRRRDVHGVEHGRRRRLRARSVSRVRPVRSQDRRPPGRARPALHAEPRGLGRMGRARGPRPDIGVLRSDDHGHTWRSIAKGLPSDFGFPIVVHPHDPDTVYVMPLEPATRTCPGGAPAVWRSENGGDSWNASPAGFRRRRASSRSCATRWTSTNSSRPRSTSAPRRDSSGWGATAARSGTACSTRCRRSTA